MEISELIMSLSKMDGPSGFESNVASQIAEYMMPYVDIVEADIMGNIIGIRKCGRQNARKLLLDAHMDEVGFIITGYTSGGFLTFSTLGGIDSRVLPASEIRILTNPPIYGIIDTLPPHVLKSDEMNTAIEIEKLYIDVGMSEEKAKSEIPLGTAGVYAVRPFKLKNNLICGKALDDRACCAIILRALELIGGKALDIDLYISISAQEEVGLRGATVSAFTADPDYAIALDTGHGETPDSANQKHETITMGNGPSLGIGPNMNRRFTSFIEETAKKSNIKYQLEVLPGMSGTDAAAIQIARGGAATALLSLPLKYMHTPVEIINTDDAEATAQLLCKVISEMKEVLQ